VSSAVEAPARIVARSQAMRAVLAVAGRLAETRSCVLLEGESGSGKDLIVHLLHESGSHRDFPLVKIHCPSIPDELLESELFGHEKGAFTDARRTKPGKLELAAGGTVYLDQVQELTPPLQAKLLRVVEEKRFERLGGTRTIEIDVRFVASSNVPLRQAVTAGRFREDLFHRLSVVPLTLPALRERCDDILPLAELFLDRERGRETTRAKAFDEQAADMLRGYHWPGNVRELRGVVERAALLAGDAEFVAAAALPVYLSEQPQSLWSGRERRPTLKTIEEAYIRHVLRETRGSQTRAAAVLGVSRKALWEKRRRFGIP
jgi:transcriptional regulator with PAS, ATPase and Fis domain